MLSIFPSKMTLKSEREKKNHTPYISLSASWRKMKKKMKKKKKKKKKKNHSMEIRAVPVNRVIDCLGAGWSLNPISSGTEGRTIKQSPSSPSETSRTGPARRRDLGDDKEPAASMSGTMENARGKLQPVAL